MKRIYLSMPHLIGLVIATALLWVAWAFGNIMSQQQPVDPVTAWLRGLARPGPWIALLLIFAIAVALSRLQDLRWPNSLRHSLIWPALGWLSASAPTLFNQRSGQTSVRLWPLVVLLGGYLCAGLILFKAKEIARRDHSSPPVIG